MHSSIMDPMIAYFIHKMYKIAHICTNILRKFSQGNTPDPITGKGTFSELPRPWTPLGEGAPPPDHVICSRSVRSPSNPPFTNYDTLSLGPLRGLRPWTPLGVFRSLDFPELVCIWFVSLIPPWG